jgi:2-polyprenyl-6-methoxyphenol hydroxylase-like FAD-dependent oxidoreductase
LLLRVEQDAGFVTAIFTDGTHEHGDLRIGADGGRSTVRELFLPGQQPGYAGYVAWRAMLDERDLPLAIHAELFANFAYCLPPGELFLAYPVPGRNNETQPGQRAYNIVWYRPTTPAQLADLCTDTNGKRHGTSIPPQLLRPGIIKWIKRGPAPWWLLRWRRFSSATRGRFSRQSSISSPRRSCSDAWRRSAMRRSSLGRIRAPGPQNAPWTPSAWPIRWHRSASTRGLRNTSACKDRKLKSLPPDITKIRR